jgi:hypothetical protein
VHQIYDACRSQGDRAVGGSKVDADGVRMRGFWRLPHPAIISQIGRSVSGAIMVLSRRERIYGEMQT